MQHVIRIRAIRARSETLGLSFGRLCRAAGVEPSTGYRWCQDKANPRMADFEAGVKAMEKVLAGRAAAVAGALGHPIADGRLPIAATEPRMVEAAPIQTETAP